MGAVYDRGSGSAPPCFRDGAGPALPDPVPERRGGHRLPARARDRGRGQREPGMMATTARQFGAWPTTWEHCWGERRWVDRFFEALEANADWLTTTTPSAWLATHAPIGRVYVPTGSYAEMGEWALPPEESVGFSHALHRAQAEGRPEARWLRGAFWRNFQVRYREMNEMHKQMLRTSDAVDAMSEGDDRARALDHLYQGQSNDTYRHGLFGGIYISHMRLAIYEHLIAAADLAETAAGGLHVAELRDLDLDGHDEVLLAGPGQVVSIDLDEGGAIGGWDLRAVRHNACAVLRRRPEAYHQKLREHDAAASSPEEGASDGPTSIHEMFLVKEPGLAAMLHYDPYERRSGLVQFPGARDDAGRVGRRRSDRTRRCGGRRIRDRDAGARPARHPAGRVRVDRGGRPQRDRPCGQDVQPGRRPPLAHPRGDRGGHEPLRGDGRGHPRARMDADDARRRRQPVGLARDRWRDFQSRRPRESRPRRSTWPKATTTSGSRSRSDVSPAADIWCAPVETISNSEAGFERVYQGEGLLLGWPLSLAAGASQTVSVRHAVATSRDHAEEERAAEERATSAGSRRARARARCGSLFPVILLGAANMGKSGHERPAGRRPGTLHARSERPDGRSRDRRRPDRPYPETAAGSRTTAKPATWAGMCRSGTSVDADGIRGAARIVRVDAAVDAEANGQTRRKRRRR